MSKLVVKPHRVVCLMPVAVAVVFVAGGCSSSHKAAPATTTTTIPATTVPPTVATTSTTAAGPTTTAPVAGGPLPAGFTVSDLTWVSDSEGWALGTAPCSHPPCTSTAHTLDGGRTWAGLPAPKAYLEPGGVGPGAGSPTCGSPVACVHGIRFANAGTGYAFGVSSLWLTTNGGHAWAQKSTDITDALEVNGGRVLRVTHAMIGCQPGCPFQVEATAVGSAIWHSLGAPKVTGISATIATEGANIYLAAFGHTAGGAPDAHTQFARSGDGGGHWAAFSDPCGVTATGSEADATAISAAPGGFVVLGCTPRVGNEAAFVVTSADAGANFGPHRDNLLGAAPTPDDLVYAVSAATGQRLVALAAGAGMASLTVSNDAGIDWTVTHSEAQPNGIIPYLGFQDALTGRAVINPKVILTTTDGGGHWSGFTFP